MGGCLVTLTFGLLLLALNLIWWVLAAPLLLLSYLWLEAAQLRYWMLVNPVRLVVALVGLPVAVLAQPYVALIPSMGDIEGRSMKLDLCWAWPYSWDVFQAVSQGFEEWADSATPARQAELRQATHVAHLQRVSVGVTQDPE